MKMIILLFLVTSQFMVNAQSAGSLVEFVNPSSSHTPRNYSHTSVIDMGNFKMLITAGQVALDKQGNLVGKGDFEKQAEQVYINLRNILTEAGGTMDNIVRTGTYILDMSNFPVFKEVRNKFINTRNPPASTLVEVDRLFIEGALIEIEVTAIIPKK